MVARTGMESIFMYSFSECRMWLPKVLADGGRAVFCHSVLKEYL